MPIVTIIFYIFFSHLSSGKNIIDNPGRPNSWRGDRILKQLILKMRDSKY